MSAEAANEEWERCAAQAEWNSSMLLAYAALANPTALRRLEQYHNAEDPAKHGRRGLRMYVNFPWNWTIAAS